MRGSIKVLTLRLSGRRTWTIMADRLSFQAQIVSIIEMLANSAVVEICKLVDDGYEALSSKLDLEREQSRRENDVLRRKLLEMDVKLRGYERRLRRSRGEEPSPVRLDLLDVKDSSEETPITSIALDTSVTSFASPSPQSSPSPTHVMMEITCRPGAKCKTMKPMCGSLKVSSSDVETSGTACRDFTEILEDPPKPKIQTDETTDDKFHPPHLLVPVELDEPSPDQLNNLGLDLALMHEQVSHLGAAYAVAQLGLGNTNSRHSSSSVLSQEEGDSLDGPATMLFTTSTHKVAALAAPPPPPPSSISTASSANAPSQTRPFKNNAAFAKEPVVCTVCRCVFSSVAALKLHHKVHIGDRPYTCPHCGKGFAQPNNLRVHLLIHTGERRYRCTLCGKSFISSSHLKRHHTVHTQEKPYSCSRCGQSFSQMCSVRRHRQQSQCGL